MLCSSGGLFTGQAGCPSGEGHQKGMWELWWCPATSSPGWELSALAALSSNSKTTSHHERR